MSPSPRIDPTTPANAATDKALAPISPTGQAVLNFPPWAVLGLSVLAVVGGSIAALPAAGVGIPGALLGLAIVLSSTATTLLGMSAGLRRRPPTGGEGSGQP